MSKYIPFFKMLSIIIYPALSKQLFMATINFQSAEGLPNYCVAPWNYYDKMAFDLMQPVLCTIQLLLTAGLFALFYRIKGKDYHVIYTPFIRTAIGLALYSFGPLNKEIFMFLTCRTVGDQSVIASNFDSRLNWFRINQKSMTQNIMLFHKLYVVFLLPLVKLLPVRDCMQGSLLLMVLFLHIVFVVLAIEVP